jgi:hypothetical protein
LDSGFIPDSLDSWTYDTIKTLVDNDYLEDQTFEFKPAIRSRSPSLNQRIVETTCAFANTDGGFMIFGIEDLGNTKQDRIKGIERSDDSAKEFGDKIKLIYPRVDFKFKNPPLEIPGKDTVLFVVHIIRNKSGPHMKVDVGRFYKRTNKGNDMMTYQEIKEAFQSDLLRKIEDYEYFVKKFPMQEHGTKQRYKEYYIRRIISWYELLIKEFDLFKETISNRPNILEFNENLHRNKLIKIRQAYEDLINRANSFYDTAIGDFKTISAMINNPYLHDKYEPLLNFDVNTLKGELEAGKRTYFMNQFAYEKINLMDTCINDINGFMILLKKELQE